jgi:hypothetical protein
LVGWATRPGNNPPQLDPSALSIVPKLIILGMDRDHELFTEVDIFDDDPENILDGTWWPIELWSSKLPEEPDTVRARQS